MKKLFLLLVILLPILVLGILIQNHKSTSPQKSSAQNLSPAPTISNSNSMEVDNWKVAWYEITNINNLKLIPNFSEKLTSQDLINKYNCKFLSNASFYAASTISAYTKDNQPTGLFISGGTTLANWQENNLFDGILSINEMQTPRITRDVPQDKLTIAIQTGPILKENNKFQSLKIQNDNESRRVVAAVTGENKLFFLSFYDPNSEFSGPLLANLPTELNNFEEKTKIIFADAINLDGGAASAFITPDVNLSEINPSGAFFCQP